MKYQLKMLSMFFFLSFLAVKGALGSQGPQTEHKG